MNFAEALLYSNAGSEQVEEIDRALGRNQPTSRERFASAQALGGEVIATTKGG